MNPKPGESHPTAHETELSDNNEAGDSGGLGVILDDEDGEQASRSSSTVNSDKTRSIISRKQGVQSPPKQRTKDAGNPSICKDKMDSPSTEAGSKSDSRSPSSNIHSNSVCPAPWPDVMSFPGTTDLQDDIRFFLAYHQENMNYHHYFLRREAEEFVHKSIIEHALKYKPLLYVLVGFAAYHYTLHQPQGKLCDFLKYYNKSLLLLRKSLESGEQHDEAMLITVLQLTIFEEYMGDWVNLVDHQQAAHTLMCEVLTPQTILTNELHRHIFIWYGLLDITVGLLAGNETILSRDWYTAIEEYDAEQAAANPNDVRKQVSLVGSTVRRFGMDFASLYAKLSRGMMPMQEFLIRNEELSETLQNMRNLLQSFDGSEYMVTSYPQTELLEDDNIFNPHVPFRFFTGPMWDINFAWIDFLATELMFKYQCSVALQKPAASELGKLALEQCCAMESVSRWPKKEIGTMLAFHSSLGIASMFLPKDVKHAMWCRKKYALLEQNGYIYPPTFRARLAETWRIPEVNHWWLPNDAGYPAVVREIRMMTEERINNPRDNFRVDIRDMKTIFGNLALEDRDTSSKESSPSTDGNCPTELSPIQPNSSLPWPESTRQPSDDDTYF